jgi:N-acetyl-1-D-myo-inositol-2-amino-2-deoxy-alpha-D-glucopyranoside deacetylase
VNSVLCVHAHPDDEALWTGGILARYADSGVRTGVVTCTARAGDVRAGELERSLGVLGAGKPRLLGYADSGSDGEIPPDSFCAAPLDESIGLLVAQLREFRPDVVVTYDAYGTYGHRDHIHAHRVTIAAVEASGYGLLYPECGDPWTVSSVWFSTYPRRMMRETERRLREVGVAIGPGGQPRWRFAGGVEDSAIDHTVDVRPWRERKWRALCEHRSQFARGNGPANLGIAPESVRNLVLDTEWFQIRARPGSRLLD